MSKSKGGGNDRMFETTAGIVHHSASGADFPRGIFTGYYGPPGGPETESRIVSSGIGERPNLLTKFTKRGKDKK